MSLFSVFSENLRKEKEAEIQEMKNQFEREYEELQNRQQEISAAAVELERKKFTEEQNKALQLQAKQLRAKFKCDMDGLRARFKMMQTAGALDRSPSASESELSLEVSDDIFIRLQYKLRFNPDRCVPNKFYFNRFLSLYYERKLEVLLQRYHVLSVINIKREKMDIRLN